MLTETRKLLDSTKINNHGWKIRLLDNGLKGLHSWFLSNFSTSFDINPSSNKTFSLLANKESLSTISFTKSEKFWTPT